MKKKLWAVVAGCIPVITAASGAQAQNNKNGPAIFNMRTLQAFVSYTDSIYAAPAVVNPLKNIKARAIRNFRKFYSTASQERWFTVEDGYMVKFIDNGMMNRVDFDRKGNWLHSIKYYGEAKLIPELRDQLKRSYYDLVITLVTEIHKNGDLIYLVQLEDSTILKKIRICNGEMDLVEEYRKY